MYGKSCSLTLRQLLVMGGNDLFHQESRHSFDFEVLNVERISTEFGNIMPAFFNCGLASTMPAVFFMPLAGTL
jgi:hypothetical protein